MAAEKKDVIKPFRFTKQEADRLKRQAGERGMKESEYIRLLLSQKPNDYPEIRILLKELINEVNAIGNNINQIAHNTNAKKEAEAAEVDEAVKLVYQALRLVKEAL